MNPTPIPSSGPAPASYDPATVLRILQLCDLLGSDVYPSSGSLLMQDIKAAYQALNINVLCTAPPLVPFSVENCAHPNSVRFVAAHVHGRESGDPSLVYLDDIRDRVDMYTTRELFGCIPYKMTLSLVEQFQDSWERLALSCLENVGAKVQTVMEARVNDVFQDQAVGPIVRQFLMEWLDVLTRDAASALRLLASYEHTWKYTADDEGYCDKRALWITFFKTAYVSHALLQQSGQVIVSPIASNGEGSSLVPGEESCFVQQARLGPDVNINDLLLEFDTHGDCEKLLTVMGSVRAYFDLAHKRFVDYCTLAIEWHFLNRLTTDFLRDFLFNKLKESGDARTHATAGSVV